jgi:uncharacterized protein YcbK (DUF882 family)
VALATLVASFAVGWTWAVSTTFRSDQPGVASAIPDNPLSASAAPPAAFLLDLALRRFADDDLYRGESGALRVVVADSLALPDSLPDSVRVAYRRTGEPTDPAADRPADAGVWNVIVRMAGAIREVPDLNLIRLVPLSQKRAGRIGEYLIGEWPFENGGAPPSAAYAPPTGLVRVTPQNQDVQVSEHFRLRDFLTKGQTDVWPKYVAMSPRLLDKLELTIDALEAMGHPVVDVGVISGFRTPTYNVSGGDPRGRGALSRHMYGDAMDLYIDNDGDGRMDDLNGDGRVDSGDGRVIVQAAERVEKEHPSLIGGIGLYRPTGAHSGFVHIDTRGYRARW